MHLIAVLALLLQDKSAEDTFKKIEETIEKAKTASIKFRLEEKPTDRQPEKSGVVGLILLKEGNKALLSFEPFVGDKAQKIYTLVCDGSRMKANSGLIFEKESAAPKNLKRNIARSMALAGSEWLNMVVLASATEKPGEDLPALQIASNFRRGDDDENAKTLHYDLSDPLGPVRSLHVRVWYDPKSYKLLKRSYQGEETISGKEYSVTESYEDFTLNAEIPDEKFKLPEK